MTISGTVTILEAAGNMAYLLPLMVTFGAARYSGNAINQGMYELHIKINKLPFLGSSLPNIGLLTYFPIAEIMAQPVVVFNEIEKVGNVFQILNSTTHNGFPVVGKNGHLVGLILRKTICSLLKFKAYSIPQTRPAVGNNKNSPTNLDTKILAPAATVFYDTLERNYPHYPAVDEIRLTPNEMVPLFNV